jgi:cell division protein FtsB
MVAKLSRLRKRRDGSLRGALFSWIFLGLIGGVGVFLVFNNIRMYQKRAELKEQARNLQAQIAQLSLREQELKAQIQTSTTEEYQEKILREQGLYQKPGEEVITVLAPEGDAQKPETPKKVWWNPLTWFSRD